MTTKTAERARVARERAAELEAKAEREAEAQAKADRERELAQRERAAEHHRAVVAELVEQARAYLDAIADPAIRELAARLAVKHLQAHAISGFAGVRDRALLQLHAELGTWELVGREVGISREMAWRPPTPRQRGRAGEAKPR